MTNAREFLDELADIIRANGRAVTIEETEENFGTFAWLSAPAPRWYDTDITASAGRASRTGRWKIGNMTVRRAMAVNVVSTTRADMKISADVSTRS